MASPVYYFVSDTHLGDGTGADRFRYPRQFLDLLLKIETEPRAHLVLLGDIMELWASPMEAILIQHAPIFHTIARIAATRRVTYVVGNHDCLPWYYFLGLTAGNINVVERFTTPAGKLIAEHGHQYDPFNRVKVGEEGQVKAPWTRRLVQAIGFLGRVGGERTGDLIETIGNRVTEAASSLEVLMPEADQSVRDTVRRGLQETQRVISRESPGQRGYPVGERTYEEAALSHLRDGFRHVVMGHTHHPLTRRFGQKSYVNTGSWVWDRYPPTYARFSGGTLELLEANTHQPYPSAAG